jgi:pilus assembly protein CpaE
MTVGVVNRGDNRKRDWAIRKEDGSVQVVLSPAEVTAAEIPRGEAGGFGIAMTMLSADVPVPEEIVERAQVLILEVEPNADASLSRLSALRAKHARLPIIAAVRDASIPVVRALLQAGVNDVLALPLTDAELRGAIERLRSTISAAHDGAGGRVISVVKSVGGVGATMIATQAASLHARTAQGGTCLFDFDLQFGNAATYLGLQPTLGLADLLDAGARVDGDLLRSVTTHTPAGLNLIAAPLDIMPLEAVSSDQVFDLVDLATRNYATVFADLPGNWTNWSLSLMARSDVVLLVVELSIASLRQAQRQIAMLRNQGVVDGQLQIVVNRMEKKLFRTIDTADAERALGHPIAFTITNDFPLVSTALDQGVLLDDIKPKNRISRDLSAILTGCEALAMQAG